LNGHSTGASGILVGAAAIIAIVHPKRAHVDSWR
jgi:hypothetical protein